jgi:hydroxyacyl-ACP dehydratase HTD2-like protein with hotdog domain
VIGIAALTPGTIVASRDHRVDEIDLFLFSAACSLPHRIHYDQEFARSEGLANVPVHGPLQVTWLTQLASEWAVQHGAVLQSSSVRHLKPAYPRELLRASLTVADSELEDNGIVLELRLAKEDGTVTTTGTATIVPRGASRDGGGSP